MTLSHALFPARTRLSQVAMVLLGSLFIAIAAQISVPMFPVPMTLQTLAVLIVGLTFGSRLGLATLLVYLGEGAMGLPVFAKGLNGVAFFGPTAGFLIGFVFLAWFVGLAVEKGWAKGLLRTAGVCLAGSAAIYIPGILWPMALAGAAGVEASWIGQAFGSYYWTYFIAPFIVGDTVKAVLAALIVTGGWAALKNRRA